MKDRQEIINLCQELSSDNLLVQGTGGNVSWKDDDTLWVKASGTSLKDSLNKEIFLPVDLIHIKDKVTSGIFDFEINVQNDTELKPSIETLLHALINKKFVIHLHAINPLSYLVRNDFSNILKKITENNITFSVIEYVKPGKALAKSLYSEIISSKIKDVYYLKNHGVIFASDNINELKEIINQTCKIMYLKPFHFDKVEPPLSENKSYVPIENLFLHNFATDNDLLTYIKKNWAIFPDHVVFVGNEPSIYKNWDEFMRSNQEPLFIFIKDKGVFHLKAITQNELEQINCYFDVICRQDFNINLSVLTNNQILELINWDAEIYRQSLIKKDIK